MLRDKVIEIFVIVDDFCKENQKMIKDYELEAGVSGKRNRESRLSQSEIMTILLTFQMGHFTNLKHYYLEEICMYYRDCFPNLVSYNRFVELQSKVGIAMSIFLNKSCLGQTKGLNFIDSTCLPVSHIKRERQHKVFKDTATKGHTSVGWFYGFKLHIIINDCGEILSFCLSKGNTDDRNLDILTKMTKNIFGKLFGDRGYISQMLADLLWCNGIQMMTKPRKNMKGQNMSQADKILLRKRAVIESVFDELKNICKLQHTRHRSHKNYLMNIISSLCAYSFFPKKPSLNIQYDKFDGQLLLTA